MPAIYIIAGCNGAGKTTAVYRLLPETFETIEFINADEIARGLSPLNPGGASISAGRIMLERIDQMIDKLESFAFETTLSGFTYLHVIDKAKLKGYEVILFFVYLNSVQLANERVAIRVSKGGHSIPKEVIERRYIKGLKNFQRYAEKSDKWYLFDNSDAEYIVVAHKFNDTRKIINFELFKTITGNG